MSKAILLAPRHFHLPSTNCCFLSLSKTVYRCKKPKDKFRRGHSMHTSPTPRRPKCFQIHGGFRNYGLEPHPVRLEEFHFRHSKTQLNCALRWLPTGSYPCYQCGCCLNFNFRGGGGYSETEKSKCQDLPEIFNFRGGGGILKLKSQSAKICLTIFNFRGGGYSETEKSKCQDLPKFQFSGGVFWNWKVKVPRSA